MFFSRAEKNQKAWALSEKPTAELCRVGKGAAELAALRHRHPSPFPLRRSACLFTCARHPGASLPIPPPSAAPRPDIVTSDSATPMLLYLHKVSVKSISFFTFNAHKRCFRSFDIFVVNGLEVFYEQKGVLSLVEGVFFSQAEKNQKALGAG